MGLDLKKLITQLKKFEDQDLSFEFKNEIDSTYKLFETASQNNEKLLNKLNETQATDKANFFFGTPEDSQIDKLFNPNNNYLNPHIVIATDGSQINPSHHEFTSACLINIGKIALPYFMKDVSLNMTSEPFIYASLDEINDFNLPEIEEENLISYERTLKEVEGLAQLAKEYIKYNLPIIALLDGTLIHWHLEKFNSSFIGNFIKRFQEAIFILKSLNIPVVSFLSNSRSNEIINMLRIFKCPYEIVDCKKHCSNVNPKNYPCNPTLNYKPIFDRRLITKILKNKNGELGTRTALYKSNSKILNYYPSDLKVYFFYMDTGNEIARIELPEYVVKNNDLFNLIHNVLTLQCKVGFGYPVSLSEAHLQAVVTKTDRQVFYDLIKEKILKKRSTPIKLSTKEFKKRVSFV